MKRRSIMLLALPAFLALAACSEKPQTASHRKADGPAWESTHKGFAAAPWKAGGNETAWESQLRNRAQSQNEYVRAAAQ